MFSKKDLRINRFYSNKVILGMAIIFLVLTAIVTNFLNPAPTAQEYKNTNYGFNFALPASWEGYSVVTSQWHGVTSDAQRGDVPVTQGPLISLRDPLWTKDILRQDIPIMVFTLGQWNDLQQDKFHIGAAPIGPSELGRTAQFVFALPARYNFAFPVGYEEVEQILRSKPLQTF